MFPLGFAFGAIAGAAAAAILGPQVAQRSRPIAKAALKTAMAAIHEAQVRKAEIAEAAEDLFAEAKAEVTAEVLAAAIAAARAKAAGSPAPTAGAGSPGQERQDDAAASASDDG